MGQMTWQISGVTPVIKPANSTSVLFINTSHRYKSAPQTPGGHYPADVAHAPY